MLRLGEKVEFEGAGPHEQWESFAPKEGGPQWTYKVQAVEVEARAFLCGAAYEGTLVLKCYRSKPASTLTLAQMAQENHVTVVKATKIVGTTRVRVQIPPLLPGASDSGYGIMAMADFSGKTLASMNASDEWKEYEMTPGKSRWDLNFHIQATNVLDEW